MTDHVHDASVPVCACGHRWAYRSATGAYTCHAVRNRYVAMYGDTGYLVPTTEAS